MASTKKRLTQNNGEETPQPKKAKADNNSSVAPLEAGTTLGTSFPASEMKTDSNGDFYWNISRSRRLTISSFKGRTMVSVREYYEKEGQELPGKKGISMTLEQFNTLVQLLPNIETIIREKGGSLDRPHYVDRESKDTTKVEPVQEESDSESDESEHD